MWKNMSLSVPVSMNPKPLSVSLLIVPSAIPYASQKSKNCDAARHYSVRNFSVATVDSIEGGYFVNIITYFKISLIIFLSLGVIIHPGANAPFAPKSQAFRLTYRLIHLLLIN